MDNDNKYYGPIPPGEILMLEFLEPIGMSQNRLAREIGVPPRRINEIIHGHRAITADTAVRFSKFFGTTAQFWMNLQTKYELDCLQQEVQTHSPSRFSFIKPLASVCG